MIAHTLVRRDIALAPMTTYKVGGEAAWYAEPTTLEELRSILELTPRAMPVAVLGRGSNVVISDEGFDGLVLRLVGGFTAIDVRSDGIVVAGGGASLPVLARTAGAEGRAGLEFYVGIPGSVGGAVKMNAGGHGSDTASVLESATILDVGSRAVDQRPAAAFELAYRHSNLRDDEIVVQARFRTEEGSPAEIETKLREITRWRKEHQPGGTLNAGSVFKNPEGVAAGALIEQAGLKGMRDGEVGVSDMHANFLVATKEATASDIFLLVHRIKATVEERMGVSLTPEVKFLGEFPDPGVAS